MKHSKIVILGNPESWHNQALKTAFFRRDWVVEFATANDLQVHLGKIQEVFSSSTYLSNAGLMLVREVPGGSLEQVIYRMDALHTLENNGVRLINSAYAIEKMVDKYYTLSLLGAAGLPIPETRMTENPSKALEAFHNLGGDVVIKPLFGSRGVGMVRVTDEEIAGRVFRAMQVGGFIYYLQKFVEHDKWDIRILVVGGECIAGMKRKSDDWKTNLSAGGRAIPFILTKEICDASLKAASVVGADYCGVDLMYNPEGELFLLEVNSMPAWQGLQTVTPFDIADRLADYCLQTQTVR
jgi:RimK family alpha-L-glutamate ligase